jgi:hypothetical protein
MQALSIEDEEKLAYMLGLHVESIEKLKEKKQHYGVFIRLLILFRFALLNTKFINKAAEPSEFLFFAGFDNEYAALKSTIAAMPVKAVMIVCAKAVSQETLSRERKLKNTLYFSFSDLLIALLIFVVRAPRLYLSLKNKHPSVIGNYFNAFCNSYLYLPTFFRLLEKCQCKFVVQSNDHNVSNRCLRLVAESMGIKNIYLQHASVSLLFPKLQYDYAFLDGNVSMEIYRNCEKNQSEDLLTLSTRISNIVLSGQKKEVVMASKNRSKKYIGLAVNTLDDVNSLLCLLEELEILGVPILVRLHPGQTKDFERILGEYIKTSPYISISTAKSQSLANFLESAFIMIAGNSSIHLEAVIAGVPSYYVELFENIDHRDYYGYVKNKVACPFPREAVKLGAVVLGDLSLRMPDIAAVQMYSATYGTKWEGREGELVAKCLVGLNEKNLLPSLFVCPSPHDSLIVYRPSD